MMHEENTFSPDIIDEQTDRASASFVSEDDARLVRSLYSFYQPLSKKNQRSLERVQKRLKRALAAHQTAAQDDSDDMMFSLPKAQPKKARRTYLRTFSLLAAVLLVALLVGSMAYLFSKINRSGLGGPRNSYTITFDGACKPQQTTPKEPNTPGIYMISFDTGQTAVLERRDPNTHQLLWSRNLAPYTVSPVNPFTVAGHLVYVSAYTSGSNRLTDNVLLTINAESGEVLGKTTFGSSSFPLPQGSSEQRSSDYDTGFLSGPVYADGKIFVGQRNGKFYAVDAKTGQKCWEYNSHTIAYSNEGSGLDANRPFVQNGVVYASIYNTVFALDSKTGRELWYQQIDETQYYDAPLLINGKLYLKSTHTSVHHLAPDIPSYIYALDPRDGQTLWSQQISQPIYQNITIANDTVYASTYDGSLITLNAKSGQLGWTKQLSEQAYLDTPLVDTDTVYIVSTRAGTANSTVNTIFALNRTDGRIKWQHPFQGGGSIGLDKNAVLVATPPGSLVALQAANGDTLWTVTGNKQTAKDTQSIPLLLVVK
ncbi:putative pyrroloquinoline-quinone binding quinoprotein [Thermosporothrix hazakensis]|jgi:outer membrane protein assembly factor BamB|uniref:Putative pyrroloquinoline-quinone binding quinoprotein n=1 Tax=Thermosporothrix hazakensis TaxID=644383 RepID=A0A326UFW4_THEHA|nr:PQQ-binding-like beta-propeller repeat protein [Thermosporothrix hazakensis]PZW29483.1 putative pyrroloquinoline-quinone binding quinoprotein [Thermosporothrix hazakensis]GCE45802.1 hypothetical protein KTH_06710 [Thermosporothrix hazakensis]